eukprot:CAMPEP_0115830710 /NCGR_PEP_ID=MMETSP0287-20121206/1756_1 /TAXON_ID=412157 /ORGANISM="Chrysochromulina rotalis, Strain UIO044" /LENGTH=86 /DNA_ID=CAMNT_0003284019 /DNA_START=795 /DNA_END=1055 /DNA_ORIENTATION=+
MARSSAWALPARPPDRQYRMIGVVKSFGNLLSGTVGLALKSQIRAPLGPGDSDISPAERRSIIMAVDLAVMISSGDARPAERAGEL